MGWICTCEDDECGGTCAGARPLTGECLGRDMDCGRPLPCPDHRECRCAVVDGKVHHRRGTCTDPVVARLGWYADDAEFPAFPPGIVGIPHKSHYVVADLEPRLDYVFCHEHGVYCGAPVCNRGHKHDTAEQARACDALSGADTENAPTSTGSIDTGP